MLRQRRELALGKIRRTVGHHEDQVDPQTAIGLVLLSTVRGTPQRSARVVILPTSRRVIQRNVLSGIIRVTHFFDLDNVDQIGLRNIGLPRAGLRVRRTTIPAVLSTPTRSAIRTTFRLEADRLARGRLVLADPMIALHLPGLGLAMDHGMRRAQGFIDPIPHLRETGHRTPATLRRGPYHLPGSISRKVRHRAPVAVVRRALRIATGHRIRAKVHPEIVTEMGPGTHRDVASTGLQVLRLAAANKTHPTLRVAPGNLIRATLLLVIGPAARPEQDSTSRAIAAISPDDSHSFSTNSSVHIAISFFEDSCIIPGT